MDEPYRNQNRYLIYNYLQIVSILLIVISGILVFFFWNSHHGFNVPDEGYLWYGSQRVLLGEVPFRDFMSYDIGRYYWSAVFMKLVGDNGIITLRLAIMVFQILALCFAFLVLVRNIATQSLFFWLLTFITLLVWMFPQYKIFDASLSIILISSLSFLVEQPSRRRYFLAGLMVGLVAVFGRNHGLYGAIGNIGVIFYLNVKRENAPNLIAAFSFWSLGVFVGYLPVLFFLIFVPGFAPAFWESIRAMLFEIKATNISLPVPWPWLLPFERMTTVEILRNVTVRLFPIAVVFFGVLGIIGATRQRLKKKKVSSVLISAIFLALPYAHYTYSRADLEHTALGVFPFLIGIFVLLASQPVKIKWFFVALLCGMSILIMLPFHPAWLSKQHINIKVAGDKLKVDLYTAHRLKLCEELAIRFAPFNQTFIAMPYFPGIYAALGRKCPMWEIYALIPRSASFQQAEIERIKAANPGFAIIDNFPVDRRDDLRYSNTHPIIDRYISDNFERLNDLSQNPAIYRSRQIKK